MPDSAQQSETVSGLILPADSPLVQFEIQRYSDGTVDDNLPHVVWVDRARPLKPSTGGIACNCKGPFYPIRDDGGAGITTPFAGYTPSVCTCMGNFIE